MIAKLQTCLITARQDDEQWMLMCTLSSWLSSIAICLALTISFVRMHSKLACHERSMTVGLTGHPIGSIICRNVGIYWDPYMDVVDEVCLMTANAG